MSFACAARFAYFVSDETERTKSSPGAYEADAADCRYFEPETGGTHFSLCFVSISHESAADVVQVLLG